MSTLVWFRRDLRLRDNPALAHALASGGPVEAVFVHTADDTAPWALGGAARWYLHQSLRSLQRALGETGLPIHFLAGAPADVLPAFALERGATRVLWNRIVEPEQERLDERTSSELEAQGVATEIFADDCLVMPETARKQDGSPYRVFTPFWKQLSSRLETSGIASRLHPAPSESTQSLATDSAAVDRLSLLDAHPWHRKLSQYWQPGERNALYLLDHFIDAKAANYTLQRDVPAADGTSRLSPALHFGEISVARVYSLVQEAMVHESNEKAREGMRRFLSEIGWREFARHVLHAFPETPERSLDRRFERTGAWVTDPDERLLRAWQQGKTGIALVDAGMRELWETGHMHNRVRMIAASFLTKNLGIHWRRGAQWFWDTLVDADLASNTLGWQWVAGCGTDAAPYFRIFNPDLQASKFDRAGEYVARWLGDGTSCGAIVDLKESRERALKRYKRVIQPAAN